MKKITPKQKKLDKNTAADAVTSKPEEGILEERDHKCNFGLWTMSNGQLGPLTTSNHIELY